MPTAPVLRDLVTSPTARLLTGEGPGVTAWVVELGRDLYLRTVPGAAVGGGRARVLVSGVEHLVTLADVAPEVHGPLDDAYRAKYGRCTPEKLSALVSDAAAATTFRVGVRRPTLAERLGVVRAVVRERARGARAAGARTAGARTAGARADVPCVSC
ncbi:DUF2255 family protein [Isoptericola jiangsuensis]|uniref:DUF2255 family protein n=1 Tax=Isoptericola jiangsuensis TaxID=548579 RepID=UPI003AAC1572